MTTLQRVGLAIFLLIIYFDAIDQAHVGERMSDVGYLFFHVLALVAAILIVIDTEQEEGDSDG
jgi:hypothetical protein